MLQNMVLLRFDPFSAPAAGGGLMKRRKKAKLPKVKKRKVRKRKARRIVTSNLLGLMLKQRRERLNTPTCNT